MFPDAVGFFAVQYSSLEESKDDCIVLLDASALLLPYTMGQVTLTKVLDVYRPLSEQKRLIVPAQAVREFARNRSKKIGDIVRQMTNQASRLGPPLKAHIGLLVEDPDFQNLQKLSEQIGELATEYQKGVNTVVAKLSGDLGTDPVSCGYREILHGCVSSAVEPKDENQFNEEMEERYSMRRPPGYKDRDKADGGAGDLLIWQTVLAVGETEKRDCVFVTADTKSDWYTQSEGAFQPRLELIEEFRLRSGGKTVHIIPLSRLLEAFDAGVDAVLDARDAERLANKTNSNSQNEIVRDQNDPEWEALVEEKERIQERIQKVQNEITRLTGDDINTSLSLPWNKAAHGLRFELSRMINRVQEIDDELLNKGLESWR